MASLRGGEMTINHSSALKFYPVSLLSLRSRRSKILSWPLRLPSSWLKIVTRVSTIGTTSGKMWLPVTEISELCLVEIMILRWKPSIYKLRSEVGIKIS